MSNTERFRVRRHLWRNPLRFVASWLLAFDNFPNPHHAHDSELGRGFERFCAYAQRIALVNGVVLVIRWIGVVVSAEYALYGEAAFSPDPILHWFEDVVLHRRQPLWTPAWALAEAWVHAQIVLRSLTAVYVYLRPGVEQTLGPRKP